MHIDAFVTIVLIVLTCGLTAYAWREAMTAWARQTIFEKRDAIFDMAVDGRLSLTSAEYRAIRSSLEASIRFAHELTLTRMVVTRVAAQAVGFRKQESEMVTAIRAIQDEETRNEIKQLVNEAHRALLSMIVLKSPILMIAALLILAVSFFLRGIRHYLKGLARDVGELVQIEAENAPVYASRPL
jgi:hypothetical protein